MSEDIAELMLKLGHNSGHVFHAGHDPAEEVPERMASIILSFLAAL